MTSSARLDVPGTANFRPLGGHATPSGRLRDDVLFRADSLADLGEQGRVALQALGVRTVVDLREDVERVQHPDDVEGLEVVVVPVPVFGPLGHVELRDLGALYVHALDECGDRLGEAVRAFCRPGALPAVVHCAAGKDRTGLVAALLLSALGVDDDAVTADYTLTVALLSTADLARLADRAREAGMSEQVLAVALDAPAEAMARVLAHVRVTHGSARAYLLAHEVVAAELDVLQETLLAR
ncbi:MAG: protein tyrosine/serine phosphatase [Frankiales bacterium]|nr:protein tyrosine/serine phosphatase [Frankiales bacterium]